MLEIEEPGASVELPTLNTRAVGIDLGTTHSLIALSSARKPKVLTDAQGQPLHPSVVAYAAGQAPLTGEAAVRQLGVAGITVVSSIKRLMGKARHELNNDHLPYSLAPARLGETILRVLAAGEALTPMEISAEILRSLKRQAEAALGETVTQAVITVPAYFDDAARAATRDAARLAGLEVLRLINEPTAAAMAYGLDKGAEGFYVVYDLGGGTFDVSVLEMQKGVFQVLATGGDANLGGDDFDSLIVEDCLQVWQQQQPELSLTPQDYALLLRQARTAKETLSEEFTAPITFAQAHANFQYMLDRERFERLIAEAVAATMMLTHRVIADAGLEPRALQGVILVGGSTRIPLIHERLASSLPCPLLADMNPDHIVALGAALQAESLTVGSDDLLLDIAPLSLGLETMGGIVEKVIARHSAIPTAMTQEFTTYQDGQTAMQLHVVQGERERVADCRSLAHFTLQGIPPMRAGMARIAVTFTIDVDGLLTVSAAEKTTGVHQEIAVKPSYGLAAESIEAMLMAALEHGAADIEHRALVEAQIEAERVIHTTEAALDEDAALLSYAELQFMQAAILHLRAAVLESNRALITERLEILEKLLEPFAEKRLNTHLTAALKGRTLQEIEQLS